ncbi:transposase [Halapricum desulfuricans]|uniref:transposase n=1 Tax=Halapricum desulfuricans TaxID=2841257 RepID=UPI00226CE183|nr:transposase [Halapricum desulfuricans]
MAVDRFLRIDWQKRDHVQRAVSQGDDCRSAQRDPRAESGPRILLVADNYGSHHAKLTQQRADELGIEFVFILPYSPTLNAIEPLGKDLKYEILPEIFADRDHFRAFLTETFLRLSHRLSFATDWIETFLPDVQKVR